MRWSKIHIPTLRQPPNDAEVISHKLLVQAGYIRQIAAGIYNYLPLAKRSLLKIGQIIREEMNAIGGQEFELPALLPSEPWVKSGRWEGMGSNMFRLQDRKKSDYCLGMTHEEIFALLAHLDVKSYKELPQTWYQIQTKFRDEARPKSGLLRVRQFTMKDSYSLDISQEGLDQSFEDHRKAYQRIYSRCGIPFTIVEADSGSMGGSASNEFMVETPAGEDWLARCDCGYAANLEKAKSRPTPAQQGSETSLEEFATPGVKTIEALAQFKGGAAAEGQIKTLVMRYQKTNGEWKMGLVLMRGDHQMNEVKAQNALGGIEIAPATDDEIFGLLGAHPGSLGAVQFQKKDVPVIAAEELKGLKGMVTGANKDGFHYRGVDVDKDIAVTTWADLRSVTEGEGCPDCGKPLRLVKCLEVGHIFKLGTKYSVAMDAHVLDQDGKQNPIIMGSYGIGLERILASAIEVHHDENGMKLPLSIAPYEVVVSGLFSKKDPTVMEKAEKIYHQLQDTGWDVLFDDRDERPGVKFKDADLVGIPIRIVVSERNLGEGKVEIHNRSKGETEKVDVAQIEKYLIDLKVKMLPQGAVS